MVESLVVFVSFRFKTCRLEYLYGGAASYHPDEAQLPS